MQNMVIINSADVAHELLDQRSSMYSDRGNFTMINELLVVEFLQYSTDSLRIFVSGQDGGRLEFCIHAIWRTMANASQGVSSKIPTYSYSRILSHSNPADSVSCASRCPNACLINCSALMKRLFTSPQDFWEHLRHHSGAIIMQVCGFALQSIQSFYYFDRLCMGSKCFLKMTHISKSLKRHLRPSPTLGVLGHF